MNVDLDLFATWMALFQMRHLNGYDPYNSAPGRAVRVTVVVRA